MVPLTSFLVEQYSIKGAMLILGGVWLNICVAGALLRPLSNTQDVTDVYSPETDEEYKIAIEKCDKCDTQHDVPQSECDIKINVIPCKNEDDECDSEIEKCDEEMNNNRNLEKSFENEKKIKIKLPQSHSEHVKFNPEITEPLVKESKNESGSMKHIHISNPRIDALKREAGATSAAQRSKNLSATSLPNSLHVVHLNKNLPNLFGSNMSVANLLYRGNSMCDLTVISGPSKMKKLQKDAEDAETGSNRSSYKELLCNPYLIRDLFILGCGYYAYYTPIVSLPAYGAELGINKFEIAWTVGLIGNFPYLFS